MSIEHAVAQFQEIQDATQLTKQGSGAMSAYYKAVLPASSFLMTIPLDSKVAPTHKSPVKLIAQRLFLNGSGALVSQPLVDPDHFVSSVLHEPHLVWRTPVPSDRAVGLNPSVIIETINNVSSIFRLSKDQVAQALGVARSTIYTWKKKTAKPRPQAIKRLIQLNIAAANWEQAGYADPYPYLEQPVVQGRTLFEILKSDPLDQELIAYVGKRITNQQLLG